LGLRPPRRDGTWTQQAEKTAARFLAERSKALPIAFDRAGDELVPMTIVMG
jgi:hypothetical protein